jgi:AcrR family transcriptional regulator
MAARTESRIPLSRERILAAGLDLADQSGIESLTMRKLGETLGFEAMSLYNHVANKDDLLDGMIDLVLAETEAPSPAQQWDAAIRASAISVYQALRRHAWACNLLMSPGRVRPTRLRYMDLLLGSLRDAGFSADTTYHAYHVLDAHIFGFSLWQSSHSYDAAQITDLVATFERMIPADVYPHLHEHAEQHMTQGPHREVSAFEFGLDLILDGLKEIHRAE